MSRRTAGTKRPDQSNRSLKSGRPPKRHASKSPPRSGKQTSDGARPASRQPGRAASRASGGTANRKSAATGFAKPKRPTSLARRRRRRLRLDRLAMLLVLCVGLGYGAFWFVAKGVPQVYARVGSDIRQIATASTPLPYSKTSYSVLSSQIAAYLSSQAGQYSVAGTDLKTGATFGYDSTMDYSAAQTEALPITMALYNEIAAGLMKPTYIVRLTAADQQAGTGYIGGMPDGTPFTVAQLARAAIDQGDVVAQNMLVRALGAEQIDSFLGEMGSTATMQQPFLLSAQDLNLSLSYLYTMDQAHPRALAPLMTDLRMAPHEDRLSAGLPVGTQIEHVAGDWPNEFHDAAIIWPYGRPIAVAICSDGVTNQAADHVEAHVAAMIAAFAQTGFVPAH